MIRNYFGCLAVTSFVDASKHTNALFGMNRNGIARFVMDDWYCRNGDVLRRTTVNLYCSESYLACGAVALHSAGDFLFGYARQDLVIDARHPLIGEEPHGTFDDEPDFASR